MSTAFSYWLARYHSSGMPGCHIPRVVGTLLALFTVFFFGFPQLALGESGVEVAKSFKHQNGLEVTDVYPGDDVYVDVLVRGYSQCNAAQQVPFDAVLAIDRSPSMLTKLDDARIAAKHFITRAMSASSNVTTGSIRIGLVSFASDAEIVANLSSNYEDLQSAVDSISSTYLGSTNMQEGLRIAQEMLYTSENAQKVIVLLTDGCPVPQTPQETYIHDILIPKAMESGIRYETVGIGANACLSLLMMLADQTGGTYQHIEHASGARQAFDHCFDDAATCAVASKIKLNETINPAVVEIIPDSWQTSEGMPLPPAEDLANFVTTGQISVNYGALRSDQTRTFTFKVRTKACLTPQSAQDTVDIMPNQATDVTYWFGQVPGSISATQRSLVCHKPPHLCVTKSYSASDRQIIIALKSMYPPTTGSEYTLKDIRVYEFPSRQYQYRPTDTPNPPDRVIPRGEDDLLYWKIASLAPGETKELRFGTDFIGSLPTDSNPMYLDTPDPKRIGVIVQEGCHRGEISLGSVKYTAPGNVLSNIQLPQVRPEESIVETVPQGRPDLFITPAYDSHEFLTGAIEILPPVFLVENARPLPGDWPALLWSRLWPGRDSKDIWVDSSTNGYVAAFRPRNDPAVISDIQARLFHVRWDPSTGWFLGVQGQGDLFYRNEANRIYAYIENAGRGVSPPMSQGLVLQAMDFSTGNYITIKTVDLPSVAALEGIFVGWEVPPGTLNNSFLRGIPGLPGGALSEWNNVGVAELRVLLNPSEVEKHTNNNSSSEWILVIR